MQLNKKCRYPIWECITLCCDMTGKRRIHYKYINSFALPHIYIYPFIFYLFIYFICLFLLLIFPYHCINYFSHHSINFFNNFSFLTLIYSIINSSNLSPIHSFIHLSISYALTHLYYILSIIYEKNSGVKQSQPSFE